MKNIVNYLVRFIENCYRIMLCGVWTTSSGSPSLRSLHKWRNEMTWCVVVDDNNWRVRLNTWDGLFKAYMIENQLWGTDVSQNVQRRTAIGDMWTGKSLGHLSVCTLTRSHADTDIISSQWGTRTSECETREKWGQSPIAMRSCILTICDDPFSLCWEMVGDLSDDDK